MRHLPSTILLLLAATLLVAAPRAQLCAPTLPPSGQPVLMPFTPVCGGLIPPPMVWALGNPGFTLSSLAPPPVPIGSPTVLMIGLLAPPVLVPAPPLLPAFGPGFFNQINLVAIPAGPSGPLPGPPVPVPIPATGGPLGVVLNVQTVVLIPGAVVVALTGATDVTI